MRLYARDLWRRGVSVKYFVAMTENNDDVDAQTELDYLRDTSGEALLANHFFVLAQWAAVHLASSPPDLVGTQLVIDVMSAILDAGEGRLGSNMSLYRSALAEIQQAWVRANQVSSVSMTTPTAPPTEVDEELLD